MATTSTSDSTPWTTRRVRERRVVAGGAWLTIAIIPSNDQFEQAWTAWKRQDRSGVWPRHGLRDQATEDGQDTQLPRPWRTSAPWASCPVTLRSGTSCQW